MSMQEMVLARQARKPMKKDQLMPQFLKVQGVTKTFRISPTSGRMNTTPAYLPIQDEAMLPWIMYRISAPTPSKILPLIMSSQQWVLLWEPKMVTKSWPRLRTMAPPQRRALAYFSQQKPMGMMKRMETALGMEQRRLNWVMLMLWMRVSSFCMVCVWLSTKLCPNIITVSRIPRCNFLISHYTPCVFALLYIGMKEEKKAKEMRDKIKERIGKKDNEREEGHEDKKAQKIERIQSYSIYIADVIGEGSFGKVYKAKTDDGQLLACKMISKAKLENMKLYSEEYAKEMEKRFKTESEFHKQLSGCANVVRLIETIENEKAYYLLMEYCESDLSKVIKQNGILTEEVALKYFTEMLEGYKSIYERNAFHRDLKPENLLIKEDVVKISDFGFVKIFNEIDQQCKSGKSKLRTESKVGSIKYMAPDMLSLSLLENENKTYNAEKSDVWSMGIILYKMLYGKEPFNGKDEEQMMKKIQEKELAFPDTVELTPEVIRNAKVSPSIKRLMKKMIEKDEASRITFKKLYSTIKSYTKEKEAEKQGSGIVKEEGEGKEGREGREGEAKNKKEQLLIVYNKLMVQIYHDSVTYATLREIGVPNYYEVTCKLMTLIHQKRTNYLETDEKGESEEVSEKIKQEISNYHNAFWGPIKNIANLAKEDTLQSLLLATYLRIKDYPEFDLLMKEVQIFLIDILLLLSLELAIVKPDYVYTWSTRCANYKQEGILKYKLNTLTILERKLNNKDQEPEEEVKEPREEKHKKHKDKTKEKKHKSKGKEEEPAREKKEEEPGREKKEEEPKKSVEKGERQKERSSRQKKQKR